jgi:hypothetical protein
MSLMTQEELALLRNAIVVRTERGNKLVQTDPRQMPRRLRVLLLSIDGMQPVHLYTQTLKGFGDIGEILVELVNLGMVKLIDPSIHRQEQASGKSATYNALDSLLDDLLYGNTTPGSFDDIVRVARAEQPKFEPPVAPPPAPVAPQAQKAQIESLFAMLDATRQERIKLKEQVAKLHRVQQAGLKLHHNNIKLQNWVFGLGLTCAALATALVVILIKR